MPQTPGSRRGRAVHCLQCVRHLFDVVWAFTESDFATFVVPGVAFGLLGALASTALVHHGKRPSLADLLPRAPAVLAYNWSNLVVFDLANQRSPVSVAEDRINKPWRPIPTGKMSIKQTRRAMLVAVPLSLCLNYYQGVWAQGVLIHIVTWLYNDLRGGDEFLVRELLIAVGYAMFNSGSLKIAGCGRSRHPDCSLNPRGLAWTAIISVVICTTMQIQDLKDQRGDRLRGRKTVVLYLGQRVSRWSIAFFVVFWSCMCARFWSAGPASSSLVMALAALVAWRVVKMQSRPGDGQTWKLWCLWLILLYVLPTVVGTELLHNNAISVD